MELLIALPKAIMIPLGILFLILALFIGGIFTVMGATLLFSKEQDTLFWHRICGLAILIYGIDIIIMDTLWFLHRCLGGNTTWWSRIQDGLPSPAPNTICSWINSNTCLSPCKKVG